MAKQSAQTTDKKMKRQLQRIHKFLKKNSKKFYQEYDTHNTMLEQLRDQLMTQAQELEHLAGKNPELTREIQSVLEIDASDGIANRLNMINLSLAYLANPRLFKKYIKPHLPVDDLTSFSFRKIPWEVDALLFITNPLLIFDLLQDFLNYRAKQTGFIYMYITNRITRLLYRFTQFLITYEDFHKITKLTVLNPKRFEPYAKQIINVVHMLCLEAKERELDDTHPIFLNDLRRLYMILARALLTLSTNGKHITPTIKNVLMELNPVLDLHEHTLKEDRVYDEFAKYHFTHLPLKEDFLKEYSKLHQMDVQYTFEFLGYLHPTDRFIILKDRYQESKSYILDLFSKLREYYQFHGDSLPHYHKEVVNTIRQIVDYTEVQNDPGVSRKFKEELFFNGILYLDQSWFLPERDSDLELASIPQIPLQHSLPPLEIFKTFQTDPEEAELKNYVFRLAELPFCYLTIEFGKPHFNLFTLGEMLLLNIPDKAHEDLIEYLLASQQIINAEKEIVVQQLPKVSRLMKKIVQKWRLDRSQIEMYDQSKHLKFYDFKQSLNDLKKTFDAYFPNFLELCKYKQFLLDTLDEIERWLAREHDIRLEELAPKWIPYFIDSDQMDHFLNSMDSMFFGKRYTQELKTVLENPEWFKERLIEIHRNKQHILEYERQRLLQKSGSSPVSVFVETLQQKKDQPIESMTFPFLIKEMTFTELKKREVQIEPYLLELARIPFRFIEYAFGKPHFVLFSLADCVLINMTGEERKMIIQFLQITRQLNDEELSILKKDMVKLIIFTQRICQKLKKGKTFKKNYILHNQINFSQFSQELITGEKIIRRKVPLLANLKDQMQIFLEGLDETLRFIAREKNKSILDLPPQQVLKMLRHSESGLKILQHLKDSSFGRAHLESFVITPQSSQTFCQYLIKEYQLNIRLSKYYEQYQQHS